jgi:N6-adenosine-specific RNA methylase IME4
MNNELSNASLSVVPNPLNITIDPEFKKLIPALLPNELTQLEENILRDGCQEPLSIWAHNGVNILIDGHNRYTICKKHHLPFETVTVSLPNRDHAELWIDNRQLGRRNLTDDQRSMVLSAAVEVKSKISRSENGKLGGRGNTKPVAESTASFIENPKPKEKTRAIVAKEANISERKIRRALEVKKADPELADKVLAGKLTLREASKLSSLEGSAREIAKVAFEESRDIRSAVRAGKKAGYTEKIALAKPKPLEGKYRVIYADPPWEYESDRTQGTPEDHYNCMSDNELFDYKVGGTRSVKDIADKDAVLFIWITVPLLPRVFAVINAWGFTYKASFVWDKQRHVFGHYNSVQHELLLVCTKGSCTPDAKKLEDSVQSIRGSGVHSQKPEEFRELIDRIYTYGRRLELFRRGNAPEGWDTDGNEAIEGNEHVEVAA